MPSFAKNGDIPRTVAIGGSSGLIGGALSASLEAAGSRVLRLPREGIDPRTLDGVDAVVNLGGTGIADGRWTAERRRSIRESRVATTDRIVAAMAGTTEKPRAFLSASAVGYYGNRSEPVTEDAPRGTGFLAEVCEAWERSALAARDLGIRTVLLRTGVVLTPRGGALAKMLPAFRAGFGGPIGGGGQGVSWISLEDVVRALHHAIGDGTVAGPINLVAPHPVPQRELARTLGRVLHRPAFLPLPAAAVKLLFGRMGEEVLLWGCFARPARLEATGFRFEHPELSGALAHALGKGV